MHAVVSIHTSESWHESVFSPDFKLFLDFPLTSLRRSDSLPWLISNADMHPRVISQQTVPFYVVITIKVTGDFFFSLCSCKCKVSHRLANHLIQPGLLTLNAGIRCKGKFYDSRLDTKRKTVSHCSFTSVAACPPVVSRQMDVPIFLDS